MIFSASLSIEIVGKARWSVALTISMDLSTYFCSISFNIEAVSSANVLSSSSSISSNDFLVKISPKLIATF